jgi:hypothetical protein
MEGKAIFFWVFLAAGGLAFALYIVVNMHSHGRACFGRRKKPADIEHGHALSKSSAARKASAATLVNDSPNVGGTNNQHVFSSPLSDTRQSSTATLVNDSPLKNASEANSQPENLPTNMTETNGQSDTTPTTVTETNAQPENETKRKPRRFGGKEDLTPLRLAKRRFGGTEDLPLRLTNQTRGTVNQSLQSARITRLERDGEEGDLGTRMPPWSAT